MIELHLQDKYLVKFLCEDKNGLQYNEVKANTVSPKHFIVNDLKNFISQTTHNKKSYKKVLKKIGDESQLLDEFMTLVEQRIKSATNVALLLNKGITFYGEEFYLFYPSGSPLEEDKLFNENIFSVIQELPFTYRYDNKRLFSFRPDITFFINGIYFGYSELKSNYNNQNAQKNGRNKIVKDYQQAVCKYLDIAGKNDLSQSIRKDMLWLFEKAIHITTTDINNTHVIRNISNYFDEIKAVYNNGSYDFENYKNKVFQESFKSVPLLNKNVSRTAKFEEVFKALYSKKSIEDEIRYFNFLERELVVNEKSKKKEYKHNDGRLIAPRPKQKFGVDKIISKIDVFLTHENEPDYFIKQFEQKLKEQKVSESIVKELITNRKKYQNNKHVYSLLLQYAAGFGKSNIIGWTALKLKDLRREGEFVYDKIMLVVDRLQLRDQLDTKMYNMNINNKMFIEASDKSEFKKALESDVRIVVVNLQKFKSVKDILDNNEEALVRLASMRVAFLIDEVHRSNSGTQHEEMTYLFDELQNSFDTSEVYLKAQQKKNIIIGFTATPSDHTLARFGEFNKYAEGEKMWIPFDSYTMVEAIKDKYILNPLKGLVPVSSKMYFEKPDDELEGFEGALYKEEIPNGTDTGIDENGKKYRIRKKKIYENEERIKAISKFIVDRLLTTVFPTIRGTAKAMLGTASITSAIKYKEHIQKYFDEQVLLSNHNSRFKDAPIFIVYSNSDDQNYPNPKSLNNGLTEKKVLQEFKHKRNGLIIVVDKLQTGFDEPKLQTLFLDKEISGINAIQTISRVNRTTKYKNDCKIVDFSYKNVNIKNIQKAFEHFSNVVVSDFNPLESEKLLEVYYNELKQSDLFEDHFENFKSYLEGNSSLEVITEFEDDAIHFIEGNPKASKLFKNKVNKYFSILNLIEFVIVYNPKYSDKTFLEFWRRFNNIYNNINRTNDIIDDVEIYFDNRIGIVEPKNYQVGNPVISGVKEPSSNEGKQYKFDILKVIEKRNQEEAEIEQLIISFEEKIELFFEFARKDDLGKRVATKILDDGNVFDQDEINSDFAKVYRKFKRRNREQLGDFFIKETESRLGQLLFDFEKDLKIKN